MEPLEHILPPRVRRDQLVLALNKYRGEGDYEKVLRRLEELVRLDVEQPRSLDFYFGESLLHVGRPHDAKVHLVRYVQDEGERGRYYHKALALLNRAEELAPSLPGG